MNSIRYCALAVSALVFPTTSLAAADWHQFRGPSRTGSTTEGVSARFPTTGPKVLWSQMLGQSYATPLAVGDRVFALGSTDSADTVYCLEAGSGKKVWTYQTTHKKRSYPPDNFSNAPLATPLISGDRIYVLAREGELHCLNTMNGKLVWKKDLIKTSGATLQYFGTSSSPIMEGNLLLFNIGAKGLAVDKATGDVKWKSAGTGGFASPVVYTRNGQREAAIFTDGAVLGLDPLTGKQRWEESWKVSGPTAPSSDPIQFEDSLLVHSATIGTKRLRLGPKPAALWQTKDLCSDFANSVVIGGYIYGNSLNRLVCLDLKTGKLLWSEKGIGQGSLIGAGDKIVVQTERGELLIVKADPAKYTELNRTQLSDGKAPLKSAGWVAPVLSGGRLYCRTVAGALVCLDVKP